MPFEMQKILTYLVFILLTLAVGGLSSIAVAKGMPVYMELEKPPLTPPSVVFPIVWSILYVLMGIGASNVWLTQSPKRKKAIVIYGVQLGLNVLWSVWFFGLHLHLVAFLWLLALIVTISLMIAAFSSLDCFAGRIQIPYLLWCDFAAYLNLAIWLLNH